MTGEQLMERLRRFALVETDDQIDDERIGWLVRGTGLEVVDWPFRGGITGMYFDGVLGVRADLSADERRAIVIAGLNQHVAGGATRLFASGVQ